MSVFVCMCVSVCCSLTPSKRLNLMSSNFEGWFSLGCRWFGLKKPFGFGEVFDEKLITMLIILATRAPFSFLLFPYFKCRVHSLYFIRNPYIKSVYLAINPYICFLNSTCFSPNILAFEKQWVLTFNFHNLQYDVLTTTLHKGCS